MHVSLPLTFLTSFDRAIRPQEKRHAAMKFDPFRLPERCGGAPERPVSGREESMGKETMRGLERGLSVLRALERTEGLALRDLHRETKLPKPTLLRILLTLEENGYARRRLTDGAWRRAARKSETPQ
jgi:IclR family mhp operon transcriptional activator